MPPRYLGFKLTGDLAEFLVSLHDDEPNFRLIGVPEAAEPLHPSGLRLDPRAGAAAGRGCGAASRHAGQPPSGQHPRQIHPRQRGRRTVAKAAGSFARSTEQTDWTTIGSRSQHRSVRPWPGRWRAGCAKRDELEEMLQDVARRLSPAHVATLVAHPEAVRSALVAAADALAAAEREHRSWIETISGPALAAVDAAEAHRRISARTRKGMLMTV